MDQLFFKVWRNIIIRKLILFNIQNQYVPSINHCIGDRIPFSKINKLGWFLKSKKRIPILIDKFKSNNHHSLLISNKDIYELFEISRDDQDYFEVLELVCEKTIDKQVKDFNFIYLSRKTSNDRAYEIFKDKLRIDLKTAKEKSIDLRELTNIHHSHLEFIFSNNLVDWDLASLQKLVAEHYNYYRLDHLENGFYNIIYLIENHLKPNYENLQAYGSHLENMILKTLFIKHYKQMDSIYQQHKSTLSLGFFRNLITDTYYGRFTSPSSFKCKNPERKFEATKFYLKNITSTNFPESSFVFRFQTFTPDQLNELLDTVIAHPHSSNSIHQNRIQTIFSCFHTSDYLNSFSNALYLYNKIKKEAPQIGPFKIFSKSVQNETIPNLRLDQIKKLLEITKEDKSTLTVFTCLNSTINQDFIFNKSNENQSQDDYEKQIISFIVYLVQASSCQYFTLDLKSLIKYSVHSLSGDTNLNKAIQTILNHSDFDLETILEEIDYNMKFIQVVFNHFISYQELKYPLCFKILEMLFNKPGYEELKPILYGILENLEKQLNFEELAIEFSIINNFELFLHLIQYRGNQETPINFKRWLILLKNRQECITDQTNFIKCLDFLLKQQEKIKLEDLLIEAELLDSIEERYEKILIYLIENKNHFNWDKDCHSTIDNYQQILNKKNEPEPELKSKIEKEKERILHFIQNKNALYLVSCGFIKEAIEIVNSTDSTQHVDYFFNFIDIRTLLEIYDNTQDTIAILNYKKDLYLNIDTNFNSIVEYSIKTCRFDIYNYLITLKTPLILLTLKLEADGYLEENNLATIQFFLDQYINNKKGCNKPTENLQKLITAIYNKNNNINRSYEISNFLLTTYPDYIERK
ncbi:hypothetical protein DICPUDRAFT_75956 [Dictyostelium purpureum]|uniref:Uncharacterized protein n=1 Tax=Dictyostelium purpureum TaxID=5786 RepID=F0ZC57_DICPU|nr:uncharacterized protein DICPUDRAFT_75956 [Dictyostelium purpureum]EGC38466.1 hypothetical protein DICPUDRAFT_75956 [Dictyostelium purpureum]|eukprot:XP_003285024.1 hypothetical protein DICPUDRAFT_75956 [Dictyostelium purpureum]